MIDVGVPQQAAGEANLERAAQFGGVGYQLAEAADLIASQSGVEDPWAAAEFSLAYAGGGREWWRASGVGEARFNDDLSRVGAFDATADAPLAASSTAEVSQHQKLTQALAAFGRDKGASAAVWRRSGEFEGQEAGAGGRWRFAGAARIPA